MIEGCIVSSGFGWVFVLFRFCRCLCMWPWSVAMDVGRCLVTSWGVKPGQLRNFWFCIASIHVDLTGEKHVACKYFANSVCVCFLLMITEILWFCGCIAIFR